MYKLTLVLRNPVRASRRRDDVHYLPLDCSSLSPQSTHKAMDYLAVNVGQGLEHGFIAHIHYSYTSQSLRADNT